MLQSSTAKSAAQSAPLFSEPRFQQPVDVAARGRPLARLLQALGAEGSPPFSAAREIADERISLFAQAKQHARARDVLLGLRDLLGYSWARLEGPDGRIEYQLAPGATIRPYEQRLYDRTVMHGAQRLLKMTTYLNTPAAEFAQRLQDDLRGKSSRDPFLTYYTMFYLSREGPRTALALLAALSSVQLRTLLEDGELTLAPAGLSERERRIVHQLGADSDQLLARIGKLPDDLGPTPTTDLVDRFGLLLSTKYDPVSLEIVDYGYGFRGVSSTGAMTLDPDHVLPDLLPVRGNPYRPERGGTPDPYARLERMPFPDAAAKEIHRETSWRDALKALARSLPMPLLSDDYQPYSQLPYRHRSIGNIYQDIGPALPDLHQKSLAVGLDALCNHHRRLWWTEGGNLLFRSRTWFVERQYEVPPAVLARVQDDMDRDGQLSPDTIVLLARLPLRQLQGLDALSGSLMRWGPEPNGNAARFMANPKSMHAYLQIFAALLPALQRRALSEAGVGVAEMSPAVQRRFVETEFDLAGAKALKEPAALRLYVAQTPARGVEAGGVPPPCLFLSAGTKSGPQYFRCIRIANRIQWDGEPEDRDKPPSRA